MGKARTGRVAEQLRMKAGGVLLETKKYFKGVTIARVA